MKNAIIRLLLLAFFAMALPALADPVLLVQQGRAALKTNDIVLANTRFEQALAEDPNHANANFFFAATRIAVLSKRPAANTFMNRLGVTAAGRDIYNWQASLATNSQGETIVPAGVSGAEMFTFIHDQLLPQIIGAGTNLAKITNPAFILAVTEDDTKLGAADVDYGDVILLRASLHVFQVFLYSITAWNTDIQLTAIEQWAHDEGTVEELLRQYPNLFTAGSPADLPSAKAAFTSAIAEYFESSTLIRARPTNIVRLFNLDFDQRTNETSFRADLEDVRSSLTGPIALRSSTNKTVHAAKFFENVLAPRPLLPRIHENTWVAGTVPDVTFGGIFFGPTEEKLEEFLEELAEPASLFSNVRRLANSQVELTLRTETWARMAVDVSTDLVSWTELFQTNASISLPAFPYAIGTNKLTFIDPSQERRFYRATSNPRTISVRVYNNIGNTLASATVIINPGNRVLPLVNGFSGSEFRIAQRFLPKTNVYTLIASAPGYTPQTATAFAWQNQFFFYLSPGVETPTSLAGRRYSYTAGGAAGNIAFNATGNGYTLTSAQGTETGTYTGNFSGTTWNLNLIPQSGPASRLLVLTFTTATSGNFSTAITGFPFANGTFQTF